MNNNLLILGAGQYGMVARELAESLNCFGRIAFLDDRNEIAIDRMDNFAQYRSDYSHVSVAVGNAEVRLKYIRALGKAGFTVARLISPFAYVSPLATLGAGVIVEPMAVIHTNAVVEAGVIVCAGAVVNHNAAVREGCLLQCNSTVVAGATMPPCGRLDYGAVWGKD